MRWKWERGARQTHRASYAASTSGTDEKPIGRPLNSNENPADSPNWAVGHEVGTHGRVTAVCESEHAGNVASASRNSMRIGNENTSVHSLGRMWRHHWPLQQNKKDQPSTWSVNIRNVATWKAHRFFLAQARRAIIDCLSIGSGNAPRLLVKCRVSHGLEFLQKGRERCREDGHSNGVAFKGNNGGCSCHEHPFGLCDH
eukprot:scaffold1052_cov339-Pavlova_lutheri.AAC.25